MPVYYDHDIYEVPRGKNNPASLYPICRYCPNSLYIVRPHAPKGTPGIYQNFSSFEEAFNAASAWHTKKIGLYCSKVLHEYEKIHGPIDMNQTHFKRSK